MITFNPGPSQLSPETENDIHRAIKDGIVSISHRSSVFTNISRECIEGLRTLLRIPSDYRVFYFDSATQVWHSMAANLVEKQTFHFINGAFSAKAKDGVVALHKHAVSDEVTWGEQNDFSAADIPHETELITACYNETSTGVKMLPEDVATLHKKAPSALLAIDITSCAGAVAMTVSDADVWYFSVQKCFGLPAGLGIAIVSPQAYERAVSLRKKAATHAGIWGWENLEETMLGEKYQTPHTPYGLNIFLLAEQCKRWNKAGGLARIVAETEQKAAVIDEWADAHKALSHFVKNPPHRSTTVRTISADPEWIARAKDACKTTNITLGAGYGKIKSSTFRIANFPAVTEPMLRELFTTLDTVV
jgi:phosphoserine aminotransferase